MNNKALGVGLLGCGNVGSAVVNELLSNNIEQLTLKKVLVKDINKTREIPNLRPEQRLELFTVDPQEIINNPEIDLVIEVMSGDKPVLDYALKAIKAKKHYVTANKELIAKHGPEIFKAANQNKVQVRLDATVGGGIPIINTMLDSLKANKITEVVGILNGTTNYILSAMKEGQEFADVLKQAQELGYAEPDPTNDLEGIDTKYKTSILSSLAFHNYVSPEEIPNEGISKISSADFHFAKKWDFSIKLLGIARRFASGQDSKESDEKISIGVYPSLISNKQPLSQIDGVTNAIQIRGHLINELLLVGPGAGAKATTSAILGDALSIAKQNLTESPLPYETSAPIDNHSPNNKHCFYVRLRVADEVGVIGQLGSILAKYNVSLSSIDQEAHSNNSHWEKEGEATLILLTHLVSEDVFKEAMLEIQKLKCIKAICCTLRVFE